MPARILLVEDDPISRDIISSLLVCHGYQVDAVEDGFSALRLTQDTAYDLVFIDYHLPEMDGYALARLMRTLTEKTETRLKMVALTADQFGLAARRGVDTIFDSILMKPIEPDRLYTFVDEFLGTRTTLQPASDAVPEPAADAGKNAAHILWRSRGIADLPIVAVFPEPTKAERDHLEYCFRLAPPSSSDCLLLTRASGLSEVETVRATGRHFLQPLFTLDSAGANIGDGSFSIGDGESWSAMATVLQKFWNGRAKVDPSFSESGDIPKRLAAYLYVAARSLSICRDGSGRTTIPYTAGFVPTEILSAIKTLAALGAVVVTPGPTRADEMRELLVQLTPKGIDWVMRPADKVQLGAG